MSDLFLKILNMSISASWLVLVVLLLRLVTKKAPKWVNVLLWGIVAVRLICPFSIESILSLIPSTETISPEIMMDRTPEISTGITSVDTVVNPIITETFAPEPIASANPLQILIPVSANLWILGIIAMLLYSAVSYFLLRRRMVTAVRLRNNIYQSENVDSPFVLGIITPRIYLPFRMDGRNLTHVIAHEQAHIRRKDHWWKPLGFLLLALHWFNPLMWVGYILLCRDIELACDEKVIKEMDNETKADYVQALVSCSVNRRMIAACPLAFGEVGVKERVKTMMNYKKPAFWIVIAAVTLCIVVAACFLTNPVSQKYQVDDVSLLEFPGLKWGMTPEEVIEALALTEEQIQSQTYSGPDSATDSCNLTVIDFPFLDEQVSIAAFQFRNETGNGYRLFNIQLFLDENADMDQVNNKLAKVYGKGTGETYLTYEIDYSGGLREIKAGGDPTLNMFIKNHPNGYSAQPIIESVESIANDPEFAIQNWVCSAKGTEVLSDEGQELIAKFMENNWRANRETVLEWLKKSPLVTISTANRSLSAAYAEVQNNPSRYTDNHIIYNADMLIYCTDWVDKLCGNVPQTEPTEPTKPTKSPDLPFLFFPEVSWGVEPYQVKEIYGLTEEHILSEGVAGDQYILHVKDVSFFGAEVASAQFVFLTSKTGVQHFLSDVMLYYPEGTDMAAVKNALTEFYTEPNDGNGFTRYRISDTGVVEAYTDYGIVDPDAVGSSGTAWWESEVKLDSLTDAFTLEMMQRRAVMSHGHDESFADAVWEYLGKEPSAFICCTDSGITEGLDPNYCTKNIVSFSAYAYISTIFIQ